MIVILSCSPAPTPPGNADQDGHDEMHECHAEGIDFAIMSSFIVAISRNITKTVSTI